MLIISVNEVHIICCVFVDEGVEITYSYWDGSGHRRTLKVKKTSLINNSELFLSSLHFYFVTQ